MLLCSCGIRLATHGEQCRECYEDKIRRETRYTEQKVIPHEPAHRKPDDLVRIARGLVK